MAVIMNWPDAEPQTRIWGTIECPEPPPGRFAYANMLSMAMDLLAGREREYPRLIRDGKITQETADARLDVIRYLVADLEWVVATHAGHDAAPPFARRYHYLPTAHRLAICEQIDAAITTLSARIKRAGQRTLTGQYYDHATALISIRWNYDSDRIDETNRLQIHANATLNQMIRQRQRKAA
jgi:hypothetical protein